MNTIFDKIKDFQPIFSLLSALFSITVLNFLIKLISLSKNIMAERIAAIKDQKGVVEERLENYKDDLARAEKWYNREIDRLKNDLSEILNKEDITINRLAQGESFGELKNEIKSLLNLY